MTNRIDPSILADLCSPQDMAISHDGQRVIYSSRPWLVRAAEHVQSSLWLADVGREFSARPITHDASNNHSPAFSPDGKYVSFVSDRAEPGEKSGLYLLALEGGGGEAWPLTSTGDEMGVGMYAWAPGAARVAFVKADEKAKERRVREKERGDANVYDEDVDFGRLRVVDVQTKEVRTLEVAEGMHVTHIVWSEDGTRIAAMASPSPRLDVCLTESRLYVVDVESGTSRQLCHIYSLVHSLGWNGDKVLWAAKYLERSSNAGTSVYSISSDGVDETPTRAAYGKTDCVGNLKIRSGKVFVHVHRGLTDVIEYLEGDDVYSEKKTAHLWDVAIRTSSDLVLVVVESEVGVPNEVYSFIKGEKVQLSQHGKHLAEMKIGRVHLCEYTHEDGTPIDGFYAVPKTLESAFSENKPQPTVLMVRGGPYGRVTNCFDYVWHYISFFMSLGYLVLCPNYRGGSSHGHDYAAAVFHDASQSYQDVVWLVKKGIEEGKIDADRVAFTGWSQGGFLAYLSAVRDDIFHYRAIMAGAGVSEWTTMPLTSDLPTFESDMSGPKPWDLDDMNDLQARKNSPIYYVKNVKSPVLIIHGEADQRTPLEQAVGFYRAMKDKDKDVKMVTYPKEGHCVPVPWEKKHYVHMMQTTETFLKKHME